MFQNKHKSNVVFEISRHVVGGTIHSVKDIMSKND